jgi:sulfur carrier protein ThiS
MAEPLQPNLPLTGGPMVEGPEPMAENVSHVPVGTAIDITVETFSNTGQPGAAQIRRVDSVMTVSQLVRREVRNPNDYFVQVNGQPVAANDRLSQGDGVSIIPKAGNSLSSGDSAPVRRSHSF